MLYGAFGTLEAALFRKKFGDSLFEGGLNLPVVQLAPDHFKFGTKTEENLTKTESSGLSADHWISRSGPAVVELGMDVPQLT